MGSLAERSLLNEKFSTRLKIHPKKISTEDNSATLNLVKASNTGHKQRKESFPRTEHKHRMSGFEAGEGEKTQTAGNRREYAQSSARSISEEHQESRRKSRTSRETPVVKVTLNSARVFSAGRKKRPWIMEKNGFLLFSPACVQKHWPLQTCFVDQHHDLQEIPGCHGFPLPTDKHQYWLVALVTSSNCACWEHQRCQLEPSR